MSDVEVTAAVDVTVIDLDDQLDDVKETDDGETEIDPETEGVTVTSEVGWTFNEIW